MADWTSDASEYLDGYLKQVAALARRQGDDAEDIVSGLRDHIAHAVEDRAGGSVDLDVLYEVLATIGTPEEVANLDTPLRGPDRSAASERGSAPLPPLPAQASRQQVPQEVIVKNRSLLGCSVAAVLITGLVIVYIIGSFILAAIFVPTLTRMDRMDESANRAACLGNLKQVAIAVKRYAEDHEGAYPTLSDQPGRLMFTADAMSPEYITDPEVLRCPSHYVRPELVPSDSSWGDAHFDDHAYFYLSHAVTSEEEWLAYVEAYRAAVLAGEGFDHDFVTPDGKTLPRLRDGVSFDLADAAASEIPVMVERHENHIPGGGNVLFLDGHVEFIKYGTRFPMTEAFVNALNSIDE